jgi:hypothetical protein
MSEPEIANKIDWKEIQIYFNIGILIINVAISLIINFHAFYKRRRNERNYQSDYDFYNKLVVDNISNLIGISHEIDIIFKESIKDCKRIMTNKVDVGDNIRSTIEQGCNNIENKYDAFNRDILPIIKCYSNELCKEIIIIIDKFYDESTLVYTEIPSSALRPNWTDFTLNRFAPIKNEYIERLFQLIKEHKPHLN